MKTAILVLTLAGLLAIPATIFATAPSSDVTPAANLAAAPSAAVARLVVTHKGDPFEATLRIEDANGVPVAYRVQMLAEGVTMLESGVAPGKYVATLAGTGVGGTSHVDTTACPSGIAVANMATTRERQLYVLGATGIRVEKKSCAEDAAPTATKTHNGELYVEAGTRKGLPAYAQSGTNSFRFRLDNEAQRVVIRATWVPTTSATGTLNIETSTPNKFLQSGQGSGFVEYELLKLAPGRYSVDAQAGGLVTVAQQVNVEVLVYA